jgi:Flp pilus assembly protein TadD
VSPSEKGRRGGTRFGKSIGVALLDDTKAIADFTKAIELEPLLAKAYFDRGMAYKARGDVAKAERDLQKARDLDCRL